MKILLVEDNPLLRKSVKRGLGGLTVDLQRNSAEVHGDPMDLTGKEFDLLASLATRHGKLMKRNDLITILYPLNSEPDSNSLDVLLARVRKKLLGSGVEIETIRGKGFILRVEKSAS